MSSTTTKPSRDPPGKPWSYWPASTQPNSLDIVWCRFPDSTELRPSPGPHPGLVKRVLRNEEGKLAAEVTYGTSNLKLDRNIPHQLVISHPRDLDEAGLVRPTRFDLVTTKVLPWCQEFFTEVRVGEGPILGRLSAINRLELNEMKPKLPPPSPDVRKALALDSAHRAGLIRLPDLAAPVPAVAEEEAVPGPRPSA
jgi:hypothetical protein